MLANLTVTWMPLIPLMISSGNILTSTLDSHAPLCTKTVTVRLECKGFNDELASIKHDLCKLAQIKSHCSLAVQSSLPALNINHSSFTKPCTSFSFSSFQTLSQTDVLELTKGSPIKACPLDPVPASVFKYCLLSLLPVLTSIVNLSLQTGIISSSFESAQLTPIIKKANLDPESLSNYHTISSHNYVFCNPYFYLVSR